MLLLIYVFDHGENGGEVGFFIKLAIEDSGDVLHPPLNKINRGYVYIEGYSLCSCIVTPKRCGLADHEVEAPTILELDKHDLNFLARFS